MIEYAECPAVEFGCYSVSEPCMSVKITAYTPEPFDRPPRQRAATARLYEGANPRKTVAIPMKKFCEPTLSRLIHVTSQQTRHTVVMECSSQKKPREGAYRYQNDGLAPNLIRHDSPKVGSAKLCSTEGRRLQTSDAEHVFT